MLLEGKKALVTGGSRGIGSAIVKAFLNEGATVYYISRSESPFHSEYQALASEKGVEVIWKKGDVGQPEIAETANEILKESGGLDILVNNAGITRDGLVFRMKDEAWNDVIQTNLTSAFYLCRPISMGMVKKKGGSIINVSSIVGVTGNAGQTNYAASKAGLIGFSKSLAKEVAKRGIRVNVLAPGFISTEMTDAMPEKAKEALNGMIPMARTGEVQEIADAAVFLASDKSTYITGQVLQIDGGMAM